MTRHHQIFLYKNKNESYQKAAAYLNHQRTTRKLSTQKLISTVGYPVAQHDQNELSLVTNELILELKK
jgi:hypothetical protein